VKDTKLTLRRERRVRELRKQKKIVEVSVFVGRVSASPGGWIPTVRDELGGLIFRVEISTSTVEDKASSKTNSS